jgi:hypothetical protein
MTAGRYSGRRSRPVDNSRMAARRREVSPRQREPGRSSAWSSSVSPVTTGTRVVASARRPTAPPGHDLAPTGRRAR